MQKDGSVKLRCLALVRVDLRVFSPSCGIFCVRAFLCYDLNLVLVVFCLNNLGIVLSTGYQVRIALHVLDRNFIKA